MKENFTKAFNNKKEKNSKFNLRSNQYTILDKILSVEDKVVFKSIFAYIIMVLSVSIAFIFGSMGYTIFVEIIKKFGVYSIKVKFELLFFGVASYVGMTFMAILAIICYDKNVLRYGEIAVKVSKVTILFVIVTMFKDSTIFGVLKELIF